MKTVSLELAKELKEAGYPQEGHSDICRGKTDCAQQNAWCFQFPNKKCSKEGHITSPTADEILEKLPARLQFEKKVTKNPDWRTEFIPEHELKELKHAGFLTIANPNRWCVNYLSNACFGVQNMAEVFWDENNLANAAAKMWLYLKKENLL